LPSTVAEYLFVPLATSAGDIGFGVVEQGIIRTVF
jgi:hypothetical protein